MDRLLVGSEYASHLTDADLRLLASVGGAHAPAGQPGAAGQVTDASSLRGNPAALLRLLEHPGVFRAVLGQGETAPGRAVPASPFLANELRRFQAGEKPPADYHYGWLDTVATAGAAGKSMRRVRVVRRPLSDYIRYEIEWGFLYNVAAGEDIRVLDLSDRPGAELPDHDFWLFDERAVVKMLYRPDGTQIGRELVEEPNSLTGLRCPAGGSLVPCADGAPCGPCVVSTPGPPRAAHLGVARPRSG